MADDIIEYGFNIADETVNFGTRIVAGLDNLYETCTLAVIKSNEDGDLHINSIIHQGKIIFSINNVLRIFSNLQCTDISFSANLQSIIDTFCINSDGKYLLLCLRNGIVRCLKLDDRSITDVWNGLENSQDFSDVFYVQAFVEKEVNILSFILSLRNGKIFRIQVDENVNTVEDSVPTKLEFLSSELLNLNTPILAVAFNNPTLFISSKDIHCFDVNSLELDTTDGLGLMKLYFCNPRFILGLNQEGRLVNVDTRTLLYHVKNESIYGDIIMMVLICTSYELL